MIEIETLLLLGAGASEPFGFPSGFQLVNTVCKMLDSYNNSEFKALMYSGCRQNEITAFQDALSKANPPSVDAWLEHNDSFVPIGKAAIAIALLNYEQTSNLRPATNWYQLLFQALDSPFETFEQNKLSVITFNYDRSLEHYLFTALSNTYYGKTPQEYAEKLNRIPIVHVYGSLGHFEWQSPKSFPVTYGRKSDIDILRTASRNIKIIPEKSKEITAEFKQAHELIAKATALYFLGFGYHKTNVERLGGTPCFRVHRVMGTGYGLSYEKRRYVERISEHRLGPEYGYLKDQKVYEFLYQNVDFNEL